MELHSLAGLVDIKYCYCLLSIVEEWVGIIIDDSADSEKEVCNCSDDN